MVAPGEHLQESHRHFSHLMAIHPLGLIDWDNGEKDQKIIKNTINDLDSLGSDRWTGYSFSWLGNLKARAMDGEGAAEALKIFAECFCLPNSFHVNGDQSGTGKSKLTYRPFTLEGNFAFAAGIQEMLLQSHTGIIYIFPAIPKNWRDVSFEKLRAEGAFLVSAIQTNGKLDEVIIMSEAGRTLKLVNPFREDFFEITGVDMASDQKQKPVIEIEAKPGMEITFERLTTRPLGFFKTLRVLTGNTALRMSRSIGGLTSNKKPVSSTQSTVSSRQSPRNQKPASSIRSRYVLS